MNSSLEAGMNYEDLLVLLQSSDPTAGTTSDPVFSPELLKEVSLLYSQLRPFRDLCLNRCDGNPATIEFLKSLMRSCPTEDVRCKAAYCILGVWFAKACHERAVADQWFRMPLRLCETEADEWLEAAVLVAVVSQQEAQRLEQQLVNLQNEQATKQQERAKSMQKLRQERDKATRDLQLAQHQLEQTQAVVVGMKREEKKRMGNMEASENEVRRLEKLMSKTNTMKMQQQIEELQKEDQKQKQKDEDIMALRKGKATLEKRNKKLEAVIDDKKNIIEQLKKEHQVKIKELEEKVEQAQRNGGRRTGGGRR